MQRNLPDGVGQLYGFKGSLSDEKFFRPVFRKFPVSAKADHGISSLVFFSSYGIRRKNARKFPDSGKGKTFSCIFQESVLYYMGTMPV
jgi:hypothetical protein